MGAGLANNVLAAVHEAARYGLYDLDRLERMILGRVRRDFFSSMRIPTRGRTMTDELDQLLKTLSFDQCAKFTKNSSQSLHSLWRT